MRAFIFLAALLCSLSSFAAARCDARVPTETVELGDVRLAYQSIGRDSDPALLLVMGLGGQLIHWPDEVVSALCEQGFRVIRYDNRDVGLSAWNVPVPSSRLTYEVVRYRLGLPVSAPYTLTDMAGDALHLLDALDIPQAHVLGASMGGMIAQHIADMAPQRLLSLTLVMTSSGAEGLPAPSESLLRLLARREAASREQAVEQQADLLAALGSPEVRGTQPGAAAEPSAGADPGDPWHRRSAAAGDARRARGGAYPWLGAEADPRSRPSLPGSLQGAVAGGGGALPEGPSAGQRRPALKPRSRSQACRRTQRPTSTLAATSQASAARASEVSRRKRSTSR